MDIVCYIPEYSKKQAAILSDFAVGCGAKLWPLHMADKLDCDIAVIFGWYKYAYPPTMHKKYLIDRQLSKGKKHLIVIESGFFARGFFYQIGWDGFAGNADFNNANSPFDRFAPYQEHLKKWKFQKGRDVVVCGQLPRDTQVQDVDHIKWCQDTVAWEKNFLGKKGSVCFRPHPRIEDYKIYGIDEDLVDHRKMFRSLKRAKVCVTYNSTSCIDSLIYGIKPVCDPLANPKSILSQSEPWPGDNSSFETLNEWRKSFFANLGYSMWNFNEMRKGLAWQHLTQ